MFDEAIGEIVPMFWRIMKEREAQNTVEAEEIFIPIPHIDISYLPCNEVLLSLFRSKIHVICKEETPFWAYVYIVLATLFGRPVLVTDVVHLFYGMDSYQFTESIATYQRNIMTR